MRLSYPALKEGRSYRLQRVDEAMAKMKKS